MVNGGIIYGVDTLEPKDLGCVAQFQTCCNRSRCFEYFCPEYFSAGCFTETLNVLGATHYREDLLVIFLHLDKGTLALRAIEVARTNQLVERTTHRDTAYLVELLELIFAGKSIVLVIQTCLNLVEKILHNSIVFGCVSKERVLCGHDHPLWLWRTWIGRYNNKASVGFLKCLSVSK